MYVLTDSTFHVCLFKMQFHSIIQVEHLSHNLLLNSYFFLVTISIYNICKRKVNNMSIELLGQKIATSIYRKHCLGLCIEVILLH
jgi:hypothetical protein